MPRPTPPLLASLTVALLAACAPVPPSESSSGKHTAPAEADGAQTPGAAQTTVNLVPIDPPAGSGALAPHLQDVDGHIRLTWLESAPAADVKSAAAGDASAEDAATEDEHTLLTSSFIDGAWSAPVTVQRGSDFFANWADVPGLGSDAEGHLYAHALRKLGAGTYAYGARVSTSTDGANWRDLGWLHDDTSETEHGFVSYISETDGALRAVWLDGRGLLDGGSMHLRSARLRGGEISASELVDDRVCECCSTDAVLAANVSIVAYRDRSEAEIRDIAVVRRTALGWSEPKIVHADGWEIFGCPVNGPALAAHGSDVALAWFTGAQDQPRVQVVFSRDAGVQFGAPILLDADSPIGRVDVAFDAAGDAHVIWLHQVDERAELRLRRVAPTGALGPVRVVAETSPERAAGVPEVASTGDKLMVVWIETGAASRLRAALLRP